MERSSDEQVVFKDYPLWLWLPGVMTLVVAVVIADHVWELLPLSLMGVVLIGFASILTVTRDHSQGTLNLHYRSLFRVSTREYPMDEICFVRLAEDSDRDRTYRIELILQSGQVIPLRSFYSVGKARKERRAERLRAALGVGNRPPDGG
jgi:hypothetical protein